MTRDREIGTDDLREEIEAALGEAAPGEEERAEWAREAMERAGEPAARPTGRRGTRLLLLPAAGLAAAVLVLALLLPPRHGPATPVNGAPEVTAEEIARQREANEAALRSEAVQKRLAEAPEGSWAGIAGGRLVAIEPDLPALLGKLAGTEVEQRFVFRGGSQGDVTYETTFPYEVVAGNGFLAAAHLTFGGGPGSAWTYTREDAPGRGPLVAPRLPDDLRPFLPVRIGPPDRVPAAEEEVTFLVATGHGGPLILPEGSGWFDFEIPGRATVRGIGGDRVFRRVLVRAAIPALDLDLPVEALGERLDPVKPWTIGGLEWGRYRESMLADCRQSGKPLALLVGDASGFWPAGALEADALREMLYGYRRAIHLTRWLVPWGLPREDSPYAQPLELVVYRLDRPGGSFRLTGRLTLTETTTPAEVEGLLATAVAGDAPADAPPDTVLYELAPRDPGAAPAGETMAEAMAEGQRILEKRLEGTDATVAGLAVTGAMARMFVTVPFSSKLTLEALRERWGRQGHLDLRIVAEDGDPTEFGRLDVSEERKILMADPEHHQAPRSTDPDYPGYRWFPWRQQERDGKPKWDLVRIDRWNFTGKDLRSLNTGLHPTTLHWIVNFGIANLRQDDFGSFTGPNSERHRGEHNGRRLAIILDGEIVAAPSLRSKLTAGGYIEGAFTQEQAEALAADLRSGALPVPLRLVSRSEQRNGKLHGHLERWHPDGRKAEEGSYRNGEKVGVWRTWNEDGSPAGAVDLGR